MSNDLAKRPPLVGPAIFAIVLVGVAFFGAFAGDRFRSEPHLAEAPSKEVSAAKDSGEDQTRANWDLVWAGWFTFCATLIGGTAVIWQSVLIRRSVDVAGVAAQAAVTSANAAMLAQRSWVVVTPKSFSFLDDTNCHFMLHYVVENIGGSPAIDLSVNIYPGGLFFDESNRSDFHRYLQSDGPSLYPENTLFPKMPDALSIQMHLEPLPGADRGARVFWGFARYRLVALGEFHYTPFVWNALWGHDAQGRQLAIELGQSRHEKLPPAN